MNKTILLGLNELNFDYIKKYTVSGHLPNFKKLFSEYGYAETTSESKYELLEPWIQWVTIHTGKTYDEHKVFRLGDIVDRKDLTQLWEIAESKGHTVGAVSPFNADNRLRNPLFFVPDPWTKTPASGSKLLKDLSAAVSQSVNDNASEKVNSSSAVAIIKSLMTYVPFRDKFKYFGLLLKVKSKVGIKAAILDRLLGDVFVSNWNKHKPEFSSLFLNSGAHFQHHYMFNSKVYDGEFKNPEWYCPADQDPLLLILKIYDDILGKLFNTTARLFIATGLHQEPHGKVTFYWRLKEHARFLDQIGVSYKEVLPRMSRDFLVKFNSEEEAKNAEQILKSFVSPEGSEIFNVDYRGNELFIELIYSKNIDDTFFIKSIELNQTIEAFKKYISFVAIKNGQHHGIGYFIDTSRKTPEMATMPLTNVFEIIKNSF
ncbi:hypothetical protein ABDK00_008320 [Niabella insulamsoli]|uniref:hypothetical protein n=1 Tax=Niabella insulamsoli TaxID=3144874 RepID=UPI0031FDF68D